jgi:phospholipid/cholesterol/gamma-HCH transport system ATP-binding protein
MTKKILIQFENIKKSFEDITVLNGISFSIFKGEITSIVGKSGAGKSVLLKHIIGLLEPDKGDIKFNGISLYEMKKSNKKDIKKNFSYMFQGNALFDSMTIFENIALPLEEKFNMSKKDIKTAVYNMLSDLDIEDSALKYPAQISGGMQKRAALARALITDPAIILFDEPTTGLDPVRKRTVYKMISDYQKKFKFTGVIVTHDIPDIFSISQHVAMLDTGKIIFEGSPEEFMRSKDNRVKSFIDGG